jgi:hypothetical protein
LKGKLLMHMNYKINEKHVRDKHDFYPTPEYVTMTLLERESFSGALLEPACGNGAISKCLIRKYGDCVISSDLIDRGYGIPNVDFLKEPYPFNVDCVITNPPFSLAMEFVIKAKSIADRKVAMLLPMQFLNSIKRYPLFQDTEFCLKRIYSFSRRPRFFKYGIETKDNRAGNADCGWFVWDKTYKGYPKVLFIK